MQNWKSLCWSWVVALAILLVGGAASIQVYRTAETRAQVVARLRYVPAVDMFADRLREYVRSQSHVTSAFAGLLAASSDVAQPDFERFGDRVVPAYPSLVAVNWLPRIAPHALPEAEPALRRAGAPTPQVRDAQGRRIAPADLDRDAFPVMLTTPLADNRGLLGFDVASSPPRRPALEQARDSGAAVASEPVELVQLPGVRGTNLYMPVYRGEEPEDVTARRQALAGYIAVVFRLDALVRDAVPQAPSQFAAHLFDVDAPPGQRLLASFGPAGSGTPSEALLAEAGLERRALDWGQRSWLLVFTPVPGAADTGGARLLLATGLLLTLALAAYVLLRERGRCGMLQVNRRLSEALADKEMLFKEIHHRIKNNLQVTSSLLQMQSLQFEDEAVRQAFRETQGRLQSIGMIHEILYRTDNVALVDLGSYLERLAGTLAQSYGAGERGIALRLASEPVALDMERAVPVALIVTEVLTNAFKHAFAAGQGGEVCVAVKRLDGAYQVTVRDSGRGMPELQARGRGLGQTLIRVLSDQLGGRYVFSHEAGTVFRLTIPADDASPIAA